MHQAYILIVHFGLILSDSLNLHFFRCLSDLDLMYPAVAASDAPHASALGLDAEDPVAQLAGLSKSQ
jgi:hypothetical protein